MGLLFNDSKKRYFLRYACALYYPSINKNKNKHTRKILVNYFNRQQTRENQPMRNMKKMKQEKCIKSGR